MVKGKLETAIRQEFHHVGKFQTESCPGYIFIIKTPRVQYSCIVTLENFLGGCDGGYSLLEGSADGLKVTRTEKE